MPATTTTQGETITYIIVPCGTCGVMIHNPEETFTVASEATETEHNGTPWATPHMGGPRTHELATCADCTAVQEQADAITAQFPGAESSNVKRDVRDCLAALDAAGLPIPSSIPSEASLRRLLAHMVTVSRSINYANLLAPTVRPESRVHVGNTRFEHVTQEQRDRIRDAYGDMLRARAGTLQQVPCPSGGCLFCGIHSIKAKSAQAGDVWRKATTTRKSLGARRKGSQRITGHLCPQCAQVRDDVEAWGPTAVETAILRHIGYKPGLGTPAFTAPAWGALTDVEPNPQPWAHIDLDDLMEKLERIV